MNFTEEYATGNPKPKVYADEDRAVQEGQYPLAWLNEVIAANRSDRRYAMIVYRRGAENVTQRDIVEPFYYRPHGLS